MKNKYKKTKNQNQKIKTKKLKLNTKDQKQTSKTKREEQEWKKKILAIVSLFTNNTMDWINHQIFNYKYSMLYYLEWCI